MGGLVEGQTARGQKNCGGPSFPFYGPLNYPLCKEDTIPELEHLPLMDLDSARNVCAKHKLESNHSKYCVAFEFKPPGVSAPQYDCILPPYYRGRERDGYFFRKQPKCRGC